MSDILKQNKVTLDLAAAIANIKRQGRGKRVFGFEHGLEPGIKQALCERFDLCRGISQTQKQYNLLREIRIYQFLGLEFMRIFPAGIIWKGLPTDTTAAPPSVGPIQSWEDLETYPWPTIEQVDFSDIEWFEQNLPDNMAIWPMTYLFQQVFNLIGFVPLCMMLYENSDLVKAVTEKVGQFYLDFTKTISQFSRIGAINIGDDMGHKTATFIQPDLIREIFIPWHKQLIAAAHKQGKLGIFHVCGQAENIMDDLIDDVKIDARHSTQDVVEPIAVSKQRWGSRVALLGGVDVDFITTAAAADVKTYTRNILKKCMPQGGFALGIGNWVADSIPFENYLAMCETAREFS